MEYTTRCAGAAALGVFLWAMAAQGQAQPVTSAPVTHPPIEAFAQLPELSQPALSPDGKHMAVIRPYKGRPVVAIYDLEHTDHLPYVIPYDNGLISAVRWARNDRLLVTITQNLRVRGDDVNVWARLIAIDSDGKNPVMLLNKMDDSSYNYNVAIIDDLNGDEADSIVMPLTRFSAYDGKTYRALFSVSLKSGYARPIAQGGHDTKMFVMDGLGHLIARLDRTEQPLTEHFYLYEKEKWTERATYSADGGNTSGIQGLNEAGDGFLRIVNNTAAPTTAIENMPLTDKQNASLIFQDPHYDIDDVLTDPWTDRVIGVGVVADMEQDHYFTPEMKALQRGLEAAFPGLAVRAVTWDATKQNVIAAVDGPQMPRHYFLLNRTTHVAKSINNTYPTLEADMLGTIKPYPYKARDGLDIPAYLTLPPGKTPKALPTIILPHGGPMARDAIGFDWIAQFLANRGYVVLQPNFRGSSGYGRNFEEAGYGQWGLKMQDDVTDGVKKLIADGIADPKRICIVGASYGGYAALAGAAFTPELYACAASWAGVSDLRQFLRTRATDYGQDSWMISSWSHYIGDRSDDADKLDAVSPARHADKIKAPILLMHGVDDSTVRIDQSEDMAAALKRAGKNVTFIPIKGETHYFKTAESRTRYLSELEKFLAANIGN